MPARPALLALAERIGVLSEYVDYTGRNVRTTSNEVREAILACMHLDASTEDAAARELRRLEQKEAEHILAPARVIRTQDSPRRSVGVHVPSEMSGQVDWHLELALETGEVSAASGSFAVDQKRPSSAIDLPAAAPSGYHRVSLELRTSRQQRTAMQSLIVAPDSCTLLSRRLGERNAFGLCANLYSLPSKHNWGVGDFRDLDALLRWAGSAGAAFVGLNPLHAVRNRGHETSPYGPVSRLYRNPIYLDVRSIPELPLCREAQERIESADFARTLTELKAQPIIDYERIWSLKLDVLRLLYRAFLHSESSDAGRRRSDFRRYTDQQGEPLRSYATFMALEEHLSSRNDAPPDWRKWPAPYRTPASATVREFARRHEDEVAFWCYLQFEFDRQLSRAAETASASGLSLGLYQDLALGSVPSGADTWAHSDLFVDGVDVGAPPDDFSAVGQDWGFPPLNPLTMRRDGYDYWIRLLRSAFDHAGALRIDHVMGLFRQFWMPHGLSDGAYVVYPADDLLGILALESRRHDAVVIGEDLGTVPPGLPERLARWNILSCQVLYFERDEKDDTFRPSTEYSDHALVTLTTHDHAPLNGFWRRRDLELRRETGSFATDEELNRAVAERERAKRLLVERLIAEGLLPNASAAEDYAALGAAAHAFLAKTPAPLVGVMLDDLAAETDPINLPGVGADRYPVWARRMRRGIEGLENDPLVQSVTQALAGRAGGRT